MESKEEKIALYNRAKDAYYNGEAIMSDLEFDELEQELGLANKGYVGSRSDKYTVAHPFIMGSLSKTQVHQDRKSGEVNWDEVRGDINRSLSKCGVIGGVTIETSCKLDGCSFEIVIGKTTADAWSVISVSTRGDGQFGTDIKPWFNYTYNNTPFWQKINEAAEALCSNDSDLLVIRGETLIDRNVFNEKYANQFANTRAFIAGCFSSIWENSEEQKAYSADMHFICYDYRVWHPTTKQYTEIDFINDKEPTYMQLRPYFNRIGEMMDKKAMAKVEVCNDCELEEWQLTQIYEYYDAYRKDCRFALDGIVIKPSVSARLHNITRERPEDCIAIKFIPMVSETTITDIVWDYKKTGEYKPVAIYEPVKMDGKEMTRASLYNYGYVESNHIGIGTRIRVSLAGDIIPFVYEILETKGEIKMPDDPNVEIDGIHLMKVMTEDELRKNKFISSANALNIPKLGPATAEKIFDMLETVDVHLDNVLMLLDEDVQQLVMQLMGHSKTAENIFNSINKYYPTLTVTDVVKSYCFANCGDRTSEICARLISGLQCDLSNLSENAYSWALNKSSREYYLVTHICESFDIPMLEEDEEEDTRIPIIMTGEPKQVTKYATKGIWLAAHPQYRETKSMNECQILFTNSLDSKTTKMKNAEKKGIEIRVYEE